MFRKSEHVCNCSLPQCTQVFNVTANTWTVQPEAYLQPMLTNDAQGIYRQDNHAWLFGWSNGTLFQARDRMWARPMSLGL
jgi:hypothetical protein